MFECVHETNSIKIENVMEQNNRNNYQYRYWTVNVPTHATYYSSLTDSRYDMKKFYMLTIEIPSEILYKYWLIKFTMLHSE
uniref:Uncharacterized protein n=1 Tax=Glossina brevipalpis TaxID=37001 RepID=A0A1A9W5Y0_9MUSC